MRRKILSRLTGSSLAVLLAAMACTPKSAPEPDAAAEPEPEPEVAVEQPAPTPTPEPVPEPPPAVEPAPSIRDEVPQPPAWSLLLASVEGRDGGEAFDALEAAVHEQQPDLPVHQIVFSRPRGGIGPDQSWLIAGDFDDEAEAKQLRRKLEGKLAVTPRVVEVSCEDTMYTKTEPWTCGDHGRSPLELAPLELELTRVAPVPGPAAAAFQHPDAEAVLVVGTNLVFEPGKTSIDISPKYRTWIWRPARGELPTKGSVTGPAPVVDPAADASPEASEPPLVEEHQALFVAAGQELWSLQRRELEKAYSRCDCDAMGEGGDPEEFDVAKPLRIPGKSSSITLKFPELYAESTSGSTQTLLAFSDPPLPEEVECASSSKDVRDDWQLAGVAGSLVFVVHRTKFQFCEYVTFAPELDMRVYDLASTPPRRVPLSELEAELEAAQVFDLRSKATRALDRVFAELLEEDTEGMGPNYIGPEYGDPINELWPENLLLSAVYPRYREWRGGVELMLQYGVDCESCLDNHSPGGYKLPHERGEVDWGEQAYVHRGKMKFPPSSRLAPPEDVAALLAYVHRQHGNWKVIGWSRITAGQPSTPDAPPTPEAPPTPDAPSAPDAPPTPEAPSAPGLPDVELGSPE